MLAKVDVQYKKCFVSTIDTRGKKKKTLKVNELNDKKNCLFEQFSP